MERRILFLKYIIVTIFAVFLIRLFSLQVWHHSFYKKSAEQNVYLNINKFAIRASIEDRNGIIIARSKPLFKITFCGMNAELSHINKILKKHGFKDAKFGHASLYLKKLSWEDLAKIFVIDALPMPDIEIDQIRVYQNSHATAHILGYLKCNSEHQYSGASGIERAYDDLLKGQPGKDVFLINAKRERKGIHHSIASKEATNLRLTIDSNLQNLAYTMLKDRIQGAVIIAKVNGEILTAVSYPSFDPQAFSSEDKKAINAYYKNPYSPLFNLFLHGTFPPGSTIKAFMLIAILMKNLPRTYFCDKIFYLGKYSFRCMAKHGTINISQMLPRSCNCAFYSASQYLTQEDLAKTWKIFGLGEPILPELKATCPKFPSRKKWKRVDSLFMQIGQGATLATIAQLTRAYARLATGKEIELSLLKTNKEKAFAELPVPKEYLDLVRRSLYDTVNDPYGTAFGIYKPIGAAGKTGTAQVKKLQEHEYGRSNRIREWKYRDHSLFCAFAPFDNPKVVGCMITMHGGAGRASAEVVLRLLDEAMQALDKEEITATASVA